jgi:hypothetical protein
MLRRNIALLLSPVGLLLISVTRLMIVADYNPTTATTIASSGGYVNTILGTVVPLVPLFLPYLAIVLLLLRRFVLGALAFGAALLISPTLLAPVTAFSALVSDWHHALSLITRYWPVSIIVIVIVIMVDYYLITQGPGASAASFTLALASTAFLLPYILYVYPVPSAANYYAEFMRQPWLSAERIQTDSGISVVGYTLTEDDNWTTVLNAKTRTVEYFRTDAVVSRQVCQATSDLLRNPQSPLVPLLHTKPAELPSCWSAAAGQPAAQQERSATAVHWISTSSTRFADVSTVQPLMICGSGQALVTLSVELSGAPAGFRVTLHNGAIMPPGAVRFAPVGRHDSFSFTFETPSGPVSRRIVAVQWRSPSGIRTNLERISVDARYADGAVGC